MDARSRAYRLPAAALAGRAPRPFRPPSPGGEGEPRRTARPGDGNRLLELDGAGAHVELPAGIFAGLTEATIEGWVKWSSFGNYSRFFDFGKSGQLMGIYNLATNRSLAFKVSRFDHSTLDQAVATNVLAPDVWVHVAAVSGPMGMQLLVNGSLAATHPSTNSFAAIGNGRNYLGLANTHDYVNPSGAKYSDAYFHGQMDEVRVWGVARTEEQICADLLKSLTGSEPGLVGLWNFDDPAQPLRDATPHGHHGRLAANARVVTAPRDPPGGLGNVAFVAGTDSSVNHSPGANSSLNCSTTSRRPPRRRPDPSSPRPPRTSVPRTAPRPPRSWRDGRNCSTACSANAPRSGPPCARPRPWTRWTMSPSRSTPRNF